MSTSSPYMRLITGMFAMLITMGVNAQLPQDLPHSPEPVDFSSPVNIIIYIVIPLLLIAGYVLWRRKFRK